MQSFKSNGVKYLFGSATEWRDKNGRPYQVSHYYGVLTGKYIPAGTKANTGPSKGKR